VARLSGVGPVWVILGVGRRSGWAGGARPATLVGRQNRGGEGEQRENREREREK